MTRSKSMRILLGRWKWLWYVAHFIKTTVEFSKYRFNQDSTQEMNMVNMGWASGS